MARLRDPEEGCPRDRAQTPETIVPYTLEEADEVGDVPFTVVNWARHLGVDPETALRGSSRKFERRFRAMERLATERGQDLARLDPRALDGLWNEARGSEAGQR